METVPNWRSKLGAVDRYENIEKLWVEALPGGLIQSLIAEHGRRERIEAKGLSSTGTSHKAAFTAETDAFNTSESRVSNLPLHHPFTIWSLITWLQNLYLSQGIRSLRDLLSLSCASLKLIRTFTSFYSVIILFVDNPWASVYLVPRMTKVLTQESLMQFLLNISHSPELKLTCLLGSLWCSYQESYKPVTPRRQVPCFSGRWWPRNHNWTI